MSRATLHPLSSYNYRKSTKSTGNTWTNMSACWQTVHRLKQWSFHPKWSRKFLTFGFRCLGGGSWTCAGYGTFCCPQQERCCCWSAGGDTGWNKGKTVRHNWGNWWLNSTFDMEIGSTVKERLMDVGSLMLETGVAGGDNLILPFCCV